MRRTRVKAASGLSAWFTAGRVAHAANCAVEGLESRLLMSVNVTNYHYDQGETGANPNETILTPANVNVSTFGKVGSLPVDGQLYAQPLVMSGVAVPGQGTEDLVYAATENDSVYAFKADGSSTTPVWHTSLLQTGETPISSSVTSLNITPWIGITGTPVIDPATNTLYAVGSFTTSSNTYQMRLYALDITTGAIKDGGPVVISATVNGTGAGSSGGKLTFSTILHLQRPALTLANGQIYMAFASHNDQGNYHGWVMAYNDTTLAQTAVWCNTPNASLGGIWMSGGGLAVDSSGNLYLTSGNGSFDANTGGKDYGMALTKLSPTLGVLDYFSPYNEASLSSADLDYGCGNAVLLPTQTGSAPNEALTLGKWGGVYLNNTDTGKMGEFSSSAPNKDLSETSTGNQQHDTFSYWNGNVYIGPDGGTLRDYSVGGGTLGAAFSSQSAHTFGAGSSPTISSNGTSNGIVWAVDNGASPAVVYAYNPANLAQLYWSSNQAANGRDTSGPGEKWTSAIVANGYVYVGGAGSVTVYGNIPYTPPPPPPPPPPPVPSGAIKGFNNFALNKGSSNPAGVPAITGNNTTLTLTTTAGNEGSSAIYATPLGYQNFTTQFTYTETGGNPPADGITFMLENDPRGASAVGGLGGGLGYAGITPSFAAEFNVYQGSSIATGTNGAINIVHNSPNTGSVDLASGNPINVILNYNGSTQTLTESLSDQVASDSYTTSYTGIDLSSILGSGTAYVGFTGATGGANSLQTITNFAYYTTPLWLSTASAASWDASTSTLTVTGAATIVADPGTDLPNIVASGPTAKLTIAPVAGATDVHVGGITLTNGASITMPSVGSGRTHNNHNVLVIGKAGASSDPTFSIDSSSKLNLADNDLIVHSGTSDANGVSAYSAVEALAALGRRPSSGSSGQPDGQWNGNGLSSSSAAAADASAGYEKIGLGVVVNSTLLTGQLTSWQVGSAIENLGANDILVKYDYLGDYALEGMVSQDDAGILQLEYDNGTTAGHTWASGSSLFDGKSDNTEAGLFQLQYGLGTGGSNGPQL